MAKEAPGSTSEHRGPAAPAGDRRRPALVVAYPRPLAIELPDSGVAVGRAWLAENGAPDTEVSGAHLKIDRRGGGLRVADAGSRNGTWVNGARLSARDLTPVEDGATLRVGRTIFVYREALEGPFAPEPATFGLVGPYGLRSVTRALTAFARTRPSNILVEGETGVGKELVARAVAAALGRDKPFAAVNVAGLARGVFESQMFGHVAGAFSDARAASPGIAVAHEGGTLFLDEIGELDLELQAKLLRLLENREVLPVGAQRAVKVDVAVVAATNVDLEAAVERGTFRRDLFARLSAARVHVPPLRERREDIFALALELARRGSAPLTAEDAEVEAVERLLLEPWSTNARGLDAALAAARRLDPAPGLRLWALEEVLGGSNLAKSALTEDIVEAAIAAAAGNVSAAADKLGVSRGKLLRFRKRT